MGARNVELALGAQTAFAELMDSARVADLSRTVGALNGSFARKTVKGKVYWYFAYRDLDGRTRQLYVGPDQPSVHALMKAATAPVADLVPLARSAQTLGCASILPRHFRIIRRLAEYEFFRAGGVLIGTHAFVALGNALGVTFTEASRTLDLDFAHAGRNVSVGLPTTMRIDVRKAIDSLQMGFLPLLELNGQPSGTLANPKEPEFRLDFLTPARRERSKSIFLDELNLPLQPLSHLELILEAPEQSVVLSSEGAVVVNVPAPARLAVHKLVVSTLREGISRTKTNKDLLQAAALIEVLAASRPDDLVEAWKDARSRGPTWRKRTSAGLKALVLAHPDTPGLELLRA